MSIPPSNDRRDATVAAVTRVSASQNRLRPVLDTIQLPVILLAALVECGVPLATFVERILGRSLWQDDAIRSVDRRVVIQASLAADGLRCVIQIGEMAFYHCSASVLHLFDKVLPATVMAVTDLDASILGDPLFAAPGIIVRRMKPLDRMKLGMGTAMLLHMPTITVWLPRAR
jgi:hypothetical protein